MHFSGPLSVDCIWLPVACKKMFPRMKAPLALVRLISINIILLDILTFPFRLHNINQNFSKASRCVICRR